MTHRPATFSSPQSTTSPTGIRICTADDPPTSQTVRLPTVQHTVNTDGAQAGVERLNAGEEACASVPEQPVASSSAEELSARPSIRPLVPKSRNAPRRPGTSLGSYINELVASAPPLTREQRDKLALLLRAHPTTAPRKIPCPGP